MQYSHNASMHLIVDIRSSSSVDSIITRYASNWVDLWKSIHSDDTISYIHFAHQNCPENGKSIIVKSPWHGIKKSLITQHKHEIFRCINFSSYAPYDSKIETISHIFDHANTLYPKVESSWFHNIFKKHFRWNVRNSWTIIVPSLVVWQEAVDMLHIPENKIEIIPYITMNAGKWDRYILNQLSISGPYWLYDGSYGSEANIYGLLHWYQSYQALGWKHLLILMGEATSVELHRTSDLIQKMSLTGSVRIIGTPDTESRESLYTHASGWVYIGAYYASGPRIELARSHKIPLLISNITSLQEYHHWAITIHPNHLGWLGESLKKLEQTYKGDKRKISNEDIMKAYAKIIAIKR